MDCEMTDLFPHWPVLPAFITASLILALTPGPGVFFIVSRSLSQGRRAGLLSVAGIAIGNLANAVAASLGLAAVFAVSSIAFTVIKYAGAIYLLYLGFNMLRSATVRETELVSTLLSSRRVFHEAFVVALLNPKTTIFFAAFLPQFINPGEPLGLQGLTLSMLFVAIAAVTDMFYALVADEASSALRNSPMRHWARRLGGGMFIGIGIYTALTDR